MSEWKEYKLGKIADIIPGFAFKSKEFGTVGECVVKIKDISPPNVDLSNTEKVDISIYPTVKIDKYRLYKGDYILAMTGATIGKAGKLKTNSVAYINQRVAKIKSKQGVCDEFIYYSIAGDDFQQFIQNNIDSHSAQENISGSSIGRFPILLPPLPEQERIAGILSSLDDKIDLLTRQNRTLEAMAETLFRQYFIENPKPNWKDGVIADIIDFNPIRKLSKDIIAPFLEMSNLSTNTYAPNGWYDRAFSSGAKFKNGDTLLARITPCLENGKTAYVDVLKDEQIAWGSTEYIVMRPEGELHPFFAYIVAKYQDFRDYAESCMSGSSGRQRVDVGNLKGYEIKIPDSERIKQFNVSVESIVGKMNCNNNQIRSLTKLRDTLLPKLMNNEIKI